MSERMPRSQFELPPILSAPKCENCSALCCWALEIHGSEPSMLADRTDAMHKPGGVTCEHLGAGGTCLIWSSRPVYGLREPCVTYHCAEAGPLVASMFKELFAFDEKNPPAEGDASAEQLFARRRSTSGLLFGLLQDWTQAIDYDEKRGRGFFRNGRSADARARTNRFLKDIADVLARSRGCADKSFLTTCDAYDADMRALYGMSASEQ